MSCCCRTDDLAFFFFTGDGLKFTFDLSLPGKRTSRKSPNTRKVRKEDILVLLRSFPSIVTAAINPKDTFIISCFSYQALPVFFFLCDVVCLCRAQIEVIHDYQESRSCVSYSLEGEDSPDLLKRWGGGSRPHICPSSVLLLMLFTLWFSLFGGNDALWLSLCLFPCARQSCDEGTHRDRTNLCGRAAGSSAGEEKKPLPPHFTIDLLMVKGPLVVLHLH